jgi:hypothetical protein
MSILEQLYALSGKVALVTAGMAESARRSARRSRS